MWGNRSKNTLIVNWGQIKSVRGGIHRDSENFLKEVKRNFPSDFIPLSRHQSLNVYVLRLVNLASLFGLAIPIDLFNPRKFAEVQVSGFRVKREQSIHIIRLHDLFPLTNPEWFRFRSSVMFKKSISAAVRSKNTLFICNSNFTLSQLRKTFPNGNYGSYVLPCSYELTEVVSCGRCKGCRNLSTMNEKFVLMVGTIEPRKSYQTILSSVDQISAKIVIVGRYGWKQKGTRNSIRGLENSGKLLWLDNCCDGALRHFYQRAGLFLSTSVEEGFNISAMEAQVLGLKLVLRENAVHLENFSDSASFFKNEREMVSIINKNLF